MCNHLNYQFASHLLSFNYCNVVTEGTGYLLTCLTVFLQFIGRLEVDQLAEMTTAQARFLDCDSVRREVERQHPGRLGMLQELASAPAGVYALTSIAFK